MTMEGVAKMKKIVAIAATGALAFCIAGCSNNADGEAASEDQQNGQGIEQNNSAYELTPSEKLNSMEVGDTAVFDPYEVTVSAVDITDSGVVAHIKVKAHDSDEILKTKYLEGGSQSGSSFDDDKIKVQAWSEVEGTITYSTTTIKQLRWNNWSMEATWKFNNSNTGSAASESDNSAEGNDAAVSDSDALRTAHDNAIATATQYFDVPNSVDFPWVDFSQERTGDVITETGTVKYKNAYGTKIEEQYWLIYDDSGVITTFKVGDVSVI